MPTARNAPSRPAWQDAGGRPTAHLAGHVVQVRQLDAATIEVCIDGYARRWPARGTNPVREAERAVVALLGRSSRD